jgi:hypothetical protein
VSIEVEEEKEEDNDDVKDVVAVEFFNFTANIESFFIFQNSECFYHKKKK